MSIHTDKQTGFVDAEPSWELLRELLGEGYSKRALSSALGINSGLQIGKVRIRKELAELIANIYEKLHNKLIADKAKMTTTHNGVLSTRQFSGYTVHEHRMR